MKLKNKNILIVGGGRGIGQAMALACAREGANVAISSRTKKEVEETAQTIREKFGVKSVGTVCDVSDPQSVRSLLEKTENEIGPLYGLVCAAAVYGPIGPLETNSIDDWKHAIEINVLGTMYCVHAAIKGMKERKEGRIILMSGGGENAIPNFSSYVTSKGAIWRLTETLGHEFAPFGIYLNAIAPGPVNTKFLDDLLAAGPEKAGKVLYEQSLKQKQDGGVPPEKAAELTVYLLCEKSKGLYGKIISAVWDNYQDFHELESLSKSNIFTMKRVRPAN